MSYSKEDFNAMIAADKGNWDSGMTIVAVVIGVVFLLVWIGGRLAMSCMEVK